MENTKNQEENKKLSEDSRFSDIINKKSIVFAIVISAFVDILGYVLIIPSLPDIATEFQANYTTIGFLIASNALAAFIFGPIWGRISDKIGRKPVILISQCGTLLAFTILGFSNSIEMIFISRIIDGIFGGQIPAIKAYIADTTDEETRPAKMGLLMMASVLGMVLGPALGGLLGTFGWRIPVYFAMGLSLTSILITSIFVVESMPKERIKYLREINMGKEKEKTTFSAKFITGVALSLLIAFMLSQFGHQMFSAGIPFILSDRLAFTSEKIGFLLTISSIIFMFFMSIAPKLIARFDCRNLMGFSFLLLALSFLLFPFLTATWMFYLFLIPFDFGMAILMPLIQSEIIRFTPSDHYGEISGWTSNFQAIADILAPILATACLQFTAIAVGSIMITPYLLMGVVTAIIFTIGAIIVMKSEKGEKVELTPDSAPMEQMISD